MSAGDGRDMRDGLLADNVKADVVAIPSYSDVGWVAYGASKLLREAGEAGLLRLLPAAVSGALCGCVWPFWGALPAPGGSLG